jgi:CobQ-like glutamine amidotransferase family enzyme
MSQIVLGTVAANKLNLNGDQGNLLALKRFLEAAGKSVRVVSISNTDEALACHFLLLGHGSIAAMESLAAPLAAINWGSVLEATPGLAVGSGTEWLAQNAPGALGIERVDRVSEFRVADLGPIPVLGYRNSDTTLPDLAMNGSFITAMLHGPVLAKNPSLVARAARATAAKAGVQLDLTSPALRVWVETLNRISSQIWALEAPDQTYPALELH